MSISVVIPTHNRPDGLAAAVKSIFNQTLLPKELIVVDDGSYPPVTKDIFAGCPDGLRAKLFQNEMPKGAPNARNRGIKEASGVWIAFLDDDDEFLPMKIEEVNKLIEYKSDVNIIYHPAEINLINESVKYYSKPKPLSSDANNLTRLLLKNEIGGTSMVIVQKKILLEVGLFDESLPALQDYELWLRCAKHKAQFHLHDVCLTKYFYNTQKKSITISNQARQEAIEVIKKKFELEYSLLSEEDLKKHKIREFKALVFKALLNKQKKTALYNQIKVFIHTLSIKELTLLLVIPFGTAIVFKLRSIIK